MDLLTYRIRCAGFSWLRTWQCLSSQPSHIHVVLYRLPCLTLLLKHVDIDQLLLHSFLTSWSHPLKESIILNWTHNNQTSKAEHDYTRIPRKSFPFVQTWQVCVWKNFVSRKKGKLTRIRKSFWATSFIFQSSVLIFSCDEQLKKWRCHSRVLLIKEFF